MSINWKVRLRHRDFWLGLIGALGTFSVALSSLLGHEECALPVVERTETMVAAFLTILALLGVVIDPTTEGEEDSSQAMTYEKPRPKN